MGTLLSLTGARVSRRSRLIGSAIALSLLTLGVGPLRAQTFTSNLRGYVRTPEGAVVSDAQIIARDVETNQRRGTTTNATGYYYIGGLRPGQYEVSLRRIGFEPDTRPIRLAIGQTHDLDFAAGEATTQLSAVVVTGVADVETRTSEV